MNWVTTWSGTVERDWLDELDHVNFLQYQRVADFASLGIWHKAKGQAETGLEFVMIETHTRYIRELRLGMQVEVMTALLAFDSKRFQLLHHINSGDELMCTVETLNLCFDPDARRVANFGEQIGRYLGSWPPPPRDAIGKLSITRK
ncbi:acyl-CoA thioesterase [Ensifer adhaerens]|uniref:acyl-CoA thioesterase n=1 Tax=Ensifer adhaerens TaxID=106592 RepID=UPI001C4DF3D3|nr:thioesterase family protein [Ensifer adhaerens]MBW0370811.1 thioesterase family protein [Ensifer adhaerens]UCM24269.1 thioesterase family protein [Ensifer adhaerens]